MILKFLNQNRSLSFVLKKYLINHDLKTIRPKFHQSSIQYSNKVNSSNLEASKATLPTRSILYVPGNLMIMH